MSDGWTNLEDLPGQVLLLPPGGVFSDAGSDYIGVYTPVAAPLMDCKSRRDPAVPTTTAGFVDWLTRHPALDASEPVPVSLGELNGMTVTVALGPNATDVCSDPEQDIDRFAEVVIGLRPADFSASVTPTQDYTLQLFDVDEKILAILIADAAPGASDDSDWPSRASSVIETFEFATGVP